MQFTAEAALLQELSVKWKKQVNQRDGELYSKYGGALDLEVCTCIPVDNLCLIRLISFLFTMPIPCHADG